MMMKIKLKMNKMKRKNKEVFKIKSLRKINILEGEKKSMKMK